MTSYRFGPGVAEQMRRADGVKIAVSRKGLVCLVFIWAAAHANRWAHKNIDIENTIGYTFFITWGYTNAEY